MLACLEGLESTALGRVRPPIAAEAWAAIFVVPPDALGKERGSDWSWKINRYPGGRKNTSLDCLKTGNPARERVPN